MPYYPGLEPATGGIPLAPAGGTPGVLVGSAGELQYGDMLLGGVTAAGWRGLVGWRSLPDAAMSDTTRPQAHGAYPGDVFGGALAVTFTFLLQGTPESKALALDTIERYTRMDGVERPLVVHDGGQPSMRAARVVARDIPQDHTFRHGPVECSVQWVCADPRRYSLDTVTVVLTLPESNGGLAYPLTYPLEYGTFNVGSQSAFNEGTEATPVVATFRGPLTDPTLTAEDWSLGFQLVLADGETLVVDTAEGTVLLNGTADRLYTITNSSDPIERCLLKPGHTDLALTAPAGSGQLTVTHRHARM